MSKMTKSFTIVEHLYDVVVMGAGGSGLECAFECAKNGLKTAVVTNYAFLLVIFSIYK